MALVSASVGVCSLLEESVEVVGDSESGVLLVLEVPSDDADGFEESGTAQAVAGLVNTAAPTPKATASPPIRPT